MYIAIFLYILFIILLWIYPKSKIIQYVSLIYVFLLFAFCGDNPDYEAYVYQYENIQDYIDLREMGFMGYLRLLKSLNIPSQGIYVLTAILYYITFLLVFKRLSSDHFSYVLSFYMFYGLFYNVVQLRFTVCLIFVYWAFYALFRVKEEKTACCCYTLLVIISSFFHTLGFVFLLFVIVRICNTKQTIIAVIGIVIVLQSLSILFENYFHAYYLYDVVSAKLENNIQMTEQSSNRLRYIALCFEIACLYSIFGGSSNNRLSRYNIEQTFRTYGINLVLMMFVTIPLMAVGGEARRISTALIPFILSFAAIFGGTPKMIKKSYVLAFMACYTIFRFEVAGANIWPFGYGEYFDVLFLSLFKENLIIKSLFV